MLPFMQNYRAPPNARGTLEVALPTTEISDASKSQALYMGDLFSWVQLPVPKIKNARGPLLVVEGCQVFHAQSASKIY